jgi:hypothetical protein
LWLATWPISAKICDRAYRISEPLLDLCVSDDPDERAAVADFLDGRPAGLHVRRAFECCGVLKALERYEFERARPEMKSLLGRQRAPLSVGLPGQQRPLDGVRHEMEWPP